MKCAASVLIISVVFAQTLRASPPVIPAHRVEMLRSEPTFVEEFNGTQLDSSRWLVSNRQKKSTSRFIDFGSSDAVRVQDGKLRLRVFEDGRVGDKRRFRSGHIESRPWVGPLNGTSCNCTGFEQKYGYVEAYVRFNTKSGAGAAFWLQSRENDPGLPFAPNQPRRDWELQPGNTPSTYLENAGAEIDIVEALARHKPDANKRLPGDPPNEFIDYTRRLVMNLHWNGYRDNRANPSELHQSIGKHIALINNEKVIGDWHRYGVFWCAEFYEFYFDGRLVWKTEEGVSRYNEFIILSMGVLDSDFTGRIPGEGLGGRNNNTDRNPTMTVEWVKWWSLK